VALGGVENSQSEKSEVVLYHLPGSNRLVRDRLRIQHVFPIPGHVVTLLRDYVPTPVRGTPVSLCLHAPSTGPRGTELGCPLAAADPWESLRSSGSPSSTVNQAVGTGCWVPALPAVVMGSQELVSRGAGEDAWRAKSLVEEGKHRSRAEKEEGEGRL